jgi:hypothetical protein
MSRGGSIVASATYRPPLAWEIFSLPAVPATGTGPTDDEELLSDGVSYNHNCRPIPAPALKALVARKPELATACGNAADDIDLTRATGLVFVSERDRGLETLHVALRCNGKVKVLSLADVYGAEAFGGVRMEDAGGFCCGAADADDPSIVYVSTKAVVEKRRAPWTAVYRTNLRTVETERLTPDGTFKRSMNRSYLLIDPINSLFSCSYCFRGTRLEPGCVAVGDEGGRSQLQAQPVERRDGAPQDGHRRDERARWPGAHKVHRGRRLALVGQRQGHLLPQRDRRG